MKRLYLLFILSFSFSTIQAQQQKGSGSVEIGVNVGTLMTGIPEVQIGYFFNDYIGIAASGGYHTLAALTLGPFQSGSSGVPEIVSLKGAYYRFGVKGQYPFGNRYRQHYVWLQAMGVYTSYKENGRRYYSSSAPEFKSEGKGLGCVIATGIDVGVSRVFYFKFGLQTGLAPTFPNLVSQFTPGFGWRGVPLQFILGLNVRFL